MDEFAHAREVRDRHRARLMATPGVGGTGLGTDAGRAVIRVYLEDADARVDSVIEDVPVVCIVTGPISIVRMVAS